MILSATIHGEYRQCRTLEEAETLIREIMATLDGGDPWQDDRWGETAALYFAVEPLTSETFADPPFTWTPVHELVVTLNRSTGFGALRWDTEHVSSNPQPPTDPSVIGDPHVPYWYKPRYTIPAAQLEDAVREFCRAEGNRPQNVAWRGDGGDHVALFLSTSDYRKATRQNR